MNENERNIMRIDRLSRIRQVMYDNYGFSPNYDLIVSLIIYRYCKQCDQIKPPRAHHCSICGQCVMRMDHHCPWVGRCVGHNNYRMFYQFLFYTILGCSYAYFTMGLFANKYYSLNSN